jgi:hypothetical protein
MPPEAVQQVQTMARDVAVVRRSVEQLSTRQEEMAQNIATLQAGEQDIRQKIAALPWAAPVPRRNPRGLSRRQRHAAIEYAVVGRAFAAGDGAVAVRACCSTRSTASRAPH